MTKKQEVLTIDNLNAKLTKAMEVVAKMQKQLRGQAGTIANQSRRLKLFEKVVESRYDVAMTEQMEERQRATNTLIQQLLFKSTVVSEVCYHARNSDAMSDRQRAYTIAAAVFCLDAGDKFWGNQTLSNDDAQESVEEDNANELTVSQWATKCVKYYNASRLALVTQDKMRA